MTITRRDLLAATAIGLVGCASPSAPTGDASAELASALDQIATNMLRASPETCTTLGVDEARAGGRFIDKLDDGSREGKRQALGVQRDGLAALRRIDRAALSAQDVVSYDVVTTAFENNLAVGAFEVGSGAAYPYTVCQMNGAYWRTPDFLESQHAVTNRDEAEAYLARLAQFETVVDQETVLVGADAAHGVVLPDFVLDATIAQVRNFSAAAPAQSGLVTSFARRLGEVADLSAADKANFAQRAEAICRDKVWPAYGRQIAALEATRPRSTHEAGIWRVPRGEEMYAAALRLHTTTTLTPDEIHEMGRDLVASIGSEMDAILRAEGLTRGSVPERLQVIAQRPDQHYSNDAAGREQLLADLNQMVREMTARMPEVFGTLTQTPLEIRGIPAHIEATQPGGYYQGGTLDGSRPGAYYINLANVGQRTKYGLPSLTYHEGVPGHHWQVSIQQEARGLPFIRSALLGFNAFQEGWGLYAEQLTDEMGVYQNNRLGRLGYMQGTIFRALRLVVDTGMHAKRWSREQAMELATQTIGNPATNEVHRYVVWPGQACSYMVGRQAIVRLREDARRAMGARFDIRGFHDTLLTNGATPLTVTEQLVRDWSARV
ncbi:hypothetical protein U91I_01982 [alpha proteobacterium U9-1i]|nr:hypothetical protein U91I_01982 [alpha proteobacterium U9-1i]